MFARHHISIHAPREGSDSCAGNRMEPHYVISIHAPREGSDDHPDYPLALTRIFLSTLPARGATVSDTGPLTFLFHFYPRSPRGERH